MPEAATALGVHSLDRFTLAVPSLDEAERFYGAFGLDVDRGPDALMLRTPGSAHVWGKLVRGDRKVLRSIRFGAYAHDMSAFRERLRDNALANMTEAGDAIWCRAPDGLAIEIVVAAKSSPDAKADFRAAVDWPGPRGAGPRSSVASVRPRRLAHLAMYTADVQRSIDFYGEMLGLRLSDRSGDDTAFLHGVHGSDHHLIGLGRSNGPGMHHNSWDVGSIAEVGQGAAQMAAAGYTMGWGLGRHVLGSNYFHYVRDPWGSYAEYSADMDYVPAGSDWPGGDHPPEDSFFQWGPPPPEDFAHNYETTA